MRKWVQKVLKLFDRPLRRPSITVEWIREDGESWMSGHTKQGRQRIRPDRRAIQIERLSVENNKLGPQKIWQPYLQLHDYHNGCDTRLPSHVRCTYSMGNFFSHLVRLRKPGLVVEFGTAFGVSGMYWLAALEDNHKGRLLTFEPNEIWAEIAEKNLNTIGSHFTLIRGPFENNIDAALKDGEKIDIALIDAIHTAAFVIPQFQLVADRLAPGGLILLDDIYFPGMAGCFDKIALDPRVESSAIICDHVGMLELK